MEKSLSERMCEKAMNRIRGAIHAAISNAAAQGKFHVYWKGDIPDAIEAELRVEGFVIEVWNEFQFNETNEISWAWWRFGNE